MMFYNNTLNKHGSKTTVSVTIFVNPQDALGHLYFLGEFFLIGSQMRLHFFQSTP